MRHSFLYARCVCVLGCTHLCLFVASFAVCLAMTKNDLTKGYGHLENTTGDVRIALLLHGDIRQQIAERIGGIRAWFLVHTILYVAVILANIF